MRIRLVCFGIQFVCAANGSVRFEYNKNKKRTRFERSKTVVKGEKTRPAEMHDRPRKNDGPALLFCILSPLLDHPLRLSLSPNEFVFLIEIVIKTRCERGGNGHRVGQYSINGNAWSAGRVWNGINFRCKSHSLPGGKGWIWRSKGVEGRT